MRGIEARVNGRGIGEETYQAMCIFLRQSSDNQGCSTSYCAR